MRVIAAWILALGLIAVPAMAGNGGAEDGKDTPKSNSSASALKPDTSATTPPLVQLLQAKGILTAAEAAQITQAASAAEANDRLAQMLLAKGLITESDYNSSVGPLVNPAGNANANVGSGHFMNALIHVPAGDGYAGDGSAGAAEEPASIHFKGITLTPGGFLA
ncbi:MAG TPA: hypothetical protein VEG64_10880, partial [Candidatus Sulfotelmatobacter sp.]|nr:hypothetical protein [Candidatus Sulfotelmatobacter sp.]